MKILHVHVESDGAWFIGQALEEPGVITQGRTLDELLFMVRDAAALLTGETDVHVELIVPPGVKTKTPGRKPRLVPKGGTKWKKGTINT